MALRLARPVVPRDDRTINVGEVAARLQASTRTVRRWIAKDGLPCLRQGRKMLFLWSEIVGWLLQKRELASRGNPAVNDIMRKLGL